MPLYAGSIEGRMRLVTAQFEQKMNKASALLGTYTERLKGMNQEVRKNNEALRRQTAAQREATTSTRSLNKASEGAATSVREMRDVARLMTRSLSRMNTQMDTVTTQFVDMNRNVRALNRSLGRVPAAGRRAAGGVRRVAETAERASTAVHGLRGRMDGLAQRAGAWWRAVGRVALSFSLAFAAIQLFKAAVVGFINIFVRAIRVTDEFNESAISIAAALTSFAKPSQDMAKVFKESLEFSKEMAEQLEIIAAQSRLTGQQLLLAFRTLTAKGIVPIQAEDLAVMRAMAEAAVLLTGSQNESLQIVQEIRSLMDGQIKSANTQLSLFVDQHLKNRGITLSLKEQVMLWRQQGTDAQGRLVVMKEMGKIFIGFVKAQKETLNLAKTWMNTLDTIANKILRFGLVPLYEDLRDSLRAIGGSLMDQNGLTREGVRLAMLFRATWLGTKSILLAVVELFISLWPAIKFLVIAATQFGLAIAMGIEGISALIKIAVVGVKGVGEMIQTFWVEGWIAGLKEILNFEKRADMLGDALAGPAARLEAMLETLEQIRNPNADAVNKSKKWAEFIERTFDFTGKIKDNLERAAKAEQLLIGILAKSQFVEERIRGIERQRDAEVASAMDSIDNVRDREDAIKIIMADAAKKIFELRRDAVVKLFNIDSMMKEGILSNTDGITKKKVQAEQERFRAAIESLQFMSLAEEEHGVKIVKLVIAYLRVVNKIHADAAKERKEAILKLDNEFRLARLSGLAKEREQIRQDSQERKTTIEALGLKEIEMLRLVGEARKRMVRELTDLDLKEREKQFVALAKIGQEIAEIGFSALPEGEKERKKAINAHIERGREITKIEIALEEKLTSLRLQELFALQDQLDGITKKAANKRNKALLKIEDEFRLAKLTGLEKEQEQIRLWFLERKAQIEALTEAGEERARLIYKAQEAANQKLVDSTQRAFDEMSEAAKEAARIMERSFSTFLFNIMKFNITSTRDFFLQMIDAMLKGIASFLAQGAVDKFLEILRGKSSPSPTMGPGGVLVLPGGTGGVMTAASQAVLAHRGFGNLPTFGTLSGGDGLLSGITSFFKKILPFQIGGIVGPTPSGGPILAKLEPGERVIPPGMDEPTTTIVNVFDPQEIPRILASTGSKSFLLNKIGGSAVGVTRRIGLA